jgi:hypothetical protein
MMKVNSTSKSELFFNECNTLIDSGKTLQTITFIFRKKNKEVSDILREHGFKVRDENREIIEFSTKYHLYKEEREVFYYLFKHPKFEEIYYIFSFNGIGDVYRTLFRTIESNDEIYFLWLPPKYFDNLKDKILDIQGSYMTSFMGRTLGREGVGKRPMFARKILYEGDDAKSASEELRFEYGVFPQSVAFVIPDNLKFKISCKGYYSLFAGDIIKFKDEIIESFILMIVDDNKQMKDAKLSVEKGNGKEKIIIKEVIFKLEQELCFDEMKDFIKALEEDNFSIYSEKLEEGSVIFSTHVVDEKKGNIFTLTSDGKYFTVVPKYQSSFVSIVRFHRFLIEKIDQSTSIIKLENGN